MQSPTDHRPAVRERVHDLSVETAGEAARDGRSTRWASHRLRRREQLVTAALRAISAHGPGAGMEEIAAAAGTSKTVIYRHFADKDQLHRAVAERVGARVGAALAAATAGAADFRAGLREVVATYLRLVAEDPHVYRFVVAGSAVEGSGGRDPVSGLSRAVSAELARRIGTHLRAGGVAASAASAWAHGLVGLVRAAADHWQSPGAAEGRLDADALADLLTDLAWGGLAPALGTTAPAGATERDAAPAPTAAAQQHDDRDIDTDIDGTAATSPKEHP